MVLPGCNSTKFPVFSLSDILILILQLSFEKIEGQWARLAVPHLVEFESEAPSLAV